MPRLSIGRRAMTVALSLMLLTAAFPLAGMVGAASASTTCSTVTPEEGSPYSQCWLDIRAPSSVRTGVAFQVQVAVTTDSSKTVVATSDPCGSKAPIELDLDGGPYTHAPYFATANAGIATFTITIPFGSGGDYNWMAFGPPFGEGGPTAPASCANTNFVPDQGPDECDGFCGVGFFAVDIPLDAPIAPCPVDTECVQATSGSGTQATLIASLGSEWDPKPPPGNPMFPYFSPVNATDQCGSSVPGGNDPNGVLGYTLASADPSGVIILAVDPRGQGVGQFNVCWTQTASFRTVTGALATTGDLPNCKQRDQVAPCIIARTGGSGGKVVFLTILATANDPDPHLYAH